jgi:hypothetical protein
VLREVSRENKRNNYSNVLISVYLYNNVGKRASAHYLTLGNESIPLREKDAPTFIIINMNNEDYFTLYNGFIR